MLNTVVMVGAFPPPLHGMAAVNKAVLDKLVLMGGNIIVIDVSSSNLNRSLFSRVARLPKVLKGFYGLLSFSKKKNDSLYISISGGFGQIYEIIFLLLARLKGMRLYIHHHSFAYLHVKNNITSILMKIAGANSIHVTQSNGMAAKLVETYKVKSKVVSVSNVVFLTERQQLNVKSSNSLKTIGFISNIAAEKGIFEFLNLVEACESQKLKIVAKIAGPFQDVEIEMQVKDEISKLNYIDYVGPKYKNEKNYFYSSIDVLIFPTLYSNETEGIVNLEAMSYGVPVIAYGRGCIPEFIDSNSGLVVEPRELFVPAALDQLKIWLNYPEEYNRVSCSTQQCFSKLYNENSLRFDQLLNDILGVEFNV